MPCHLVAKVQKVRTAGAEVVEADAIDLTPREKAYVKGDSDIAEIHRKWVFCTNKYQGMSITNW